MPPVLTTMPRASQSPEILDGQNIASMERDVVDPQDPRKLTRGASQELAAKLKRTASLQQKSKEEDGSKTQRIKGSGRRNKSTKDSSSCLSTEEVSENTPQSYPFTPFSDAFFAGASNGIEALIWFRAPLLIM